VRQPTLLDLNAAVGALAGFLRRLIGEDIELTLRPTLDLPPVHAIVRSSSRCSSTSRQRARRDAARGGSRSPPAR